MTSEIRSEAIEHTAPRAARADEADYSGRHMGVVS